MLADFAIRKNDYAPGIDVLAISPSFPAQLGWQDPPPPPQVHPFWGKGVGAFPVDYRQTSVDFWTTVLGEPPIAIMSFSRNRYDFVWEFEEFARNHGQSRWWTLLDYYDMAGIPRSLTLDPPHAGGSAQDGSPYSGAGAFPDGRPDITNALADPNDMDMSLGRRDSNLPHADMIAALGAEFNPAELSPQLDTTGDVGEFVSEYMAYHVAWYRDYINVLHPNDPERECQFAGHTHVGYRITPADAKKAVKIQLDKLIESIQ